MIKQLKEPPLEFQILTELSEIKKLLTGSEKLRSFQNEKMYTPKEICVKYDISRNTLEKYFRNGWLTPLRLSPVSRKIYISEVELSKVFRAS